jgi:hypothetical protein
MEHEDILHYANFNCVISNCYTHTSQIEWFDLNNQFSIIWITFVVNYHVDTYNYHCPHISTIAVTPQDSKPKTQN